MAATPNRLTFSPGLGRGERPTNPFHVEEFDADQVSAVLAAAGFESIVMHGVHHGPGIPDDLVAEQIRAVLADHWPERLLRRVASVSVSDFDIGTQHIDASLDLVGVGRAPVAS